MSILGIDLGTGACKGVAFDYAGNVLAKSEKDYQTFSAKPGWCELDAECFLNAIRDISVSYTHLDVYKRQPKSCS